MLHAQNECAASATYLSTHLNLLLRHHSRCCYLHWCPLCCCWHPVYWLFVWLFVTLPFALVLSIVLPCLRSCCCLWCRLLRWHMCRYWCPANLCWHPFRCRSHCHHVHHVTPSRCWCWLVRHLVCSCYRACCRALFLVTAAAAAIRSHLVGGSRVQRDGDDAVAAAAHVAVSWVRLSPLLVGCWSRAGRWWCCCCCVHHGVVGWGCSGCRGCWLALV